MSQIISSRSPTDAAAALTLRTALNWMDSVPSETPLPAMPGFDRDWVESMLDGHSDGTAEPTMAEALTMAIEWIAAVPAEFKAALPPIDPSVQSPSNRMKACQ